MTISRIIHSKFTLFLSLFILLSVVFGCGFSATAMADSIDDAPDIRVLLKGSSSEYSYSITVHAGSYNIVYASDTSQIIDTISAGSSYTFYSGDGLMAVPVDESTAIFTFNGTNYRGSFKVMTNGSYCYAINVVNVEQYLYGVVGREMGYNYHIESTKAQAVAARSYAIGNISSSNKYYDVTATTSSQVYGGYSAETDRIREAVNGTCGMVVMYDGKVIQTYFASSAGGYTEDIEKVWLSDAVPLKGVPSPYDAYSGNYSSYGASCWSWTATYTPEELVSRANSYGKTDIGDYVGISMSTTYKDQTSVSGRAMIVTITGTKGSVSATKDNIRSLLNLKSTLISIEDNTSSPVAGYVLGAKGNLVAWESFDGLYGKSSSKSDKANGSNGSIYVVTADGKKQINKNTTYSDEIVIKGYGYGHGVGMSQWGAIAMGDDGWTWDDIIEHYYCHAGIELVSYYE